ncbi:MAG TPA: hypothetical protein VF628_10840, partial [Allosphingosinicella sp.]
MRSVAGRIAYQQVHRLTSVGALYPAFTRTGPQAPRRTGRGIRGARGGPGMDLSQKLDAEDA